MYLDDDKPVTFWGAVGYLAGGAAMLLAFGAFILWGLR